MSRTMSINTRFLASSKTSNPPVLQLNTSKPSRKLSLESQVTRGDLVDTHIIVPPDGGWGWLIVAASFFCNFVADGVLYTFSLFLAEISLDLGAPQKKVAIGNAIMAGCYLLLGPLACALVNRFGFRLVGIIGGLTAATAFLTSTMAHDALSFVLVYGIVGGTGFCMVFSTSMLVVGFYFEKWRPLATCLASTGSSFGVLTFPSIVTLLSKYDWRTKHYMLAGGCLLTSVCALLYRPLRLLQTEHKLQFVDLEANNSIEYVAKKFGCCRRAFQRFNNLKYPTVKDVHSTSMTTVAAPVRTYSSSSMFIASTLESSLMTVNTTYRIDQKSLFTVSEETILSRWNCCSRCKRCCRQCRLALSRPTEPNRPLYRDDIFYHMSLVHLSEYRTAASKSDMSTKLPSTVDYHKSVSRVATQRDVEEQWFKCCPEAIKRTLATMLDFRLMQSPSFSLLVISGFLSVTAMYVPFIYTTSRAIKVGIPKEVAVHLLTTMGAANALGRILCGLISLIPNVNSLIVTYTSLLLNGSAILASNFLHEEYGQFAFAGVFGLTLAALTALRPSLIVELIGLQKLTNAFGIVLMLQGVGSFIGITVAGAIVEATGSYNNGFVFAGCCMTLSAVLLMPIKKINSWENRKAAQKNKSLHN